MVHLGRTTALALGMLATTGCTGSPEVEPVCAPEREAEIRKVAAYTMEQSWDDWGWNTGVALSGLVAASKCTRDPAPVDAVQAWIDDRMAEGVVLHHINGIAPGPALLAVYERDGDPAYLDLAVELGDLLVDEYPKIDGAFEHVPGQLWVDTTFMSAPFLVELGTVTGESRYTELGVDQVLFHGDRLQRDDGLWHHGWVASAIDEGGDPLNGVMWARGNGWAAASSAEVLERLPDGHPRAGELESRLARQLATARMHQSADGGWHTIVDDPASYLESSATSLLTRASLVAEQRGILGVDVDSTRRALDHLAQLTDADGRLGGVSGPTVLSKDPGYYAARPHGAAALYAQGAYLLLLTETP